jgi:hypothetical protein
VETDLFGVLAVLALIAGITMGIQARRGNRRAWPWLVAGVIGFFILVAFGGAM